MTPLKRRRWLAAGLAWGLGATGVSGLADAATAPAGGADAAAVAPAEARAALGALALQGQGQLRFMGLRVYEALLWSPAGQPLSTEPWAQPLALEIRYQRALKGRQIAERSLQEMKRQGDIDEATAKRWLQAMWGLFPDVVEGSRITGLHLPGEGARFYVNGALKGGVNDTEFARRFFGIWLSPQSSDPKLRDALLGRPSTTAKP
jgi:hypothetical protein